MPLKPHVLERAFLVVFVHFLRRKKYDPRRRVPSSSSESCAAVSTTNKAAYAPHRRRTPLSQPADGVPKVGIIVVFSLSFSQFSQSGTCALRWWFERQLLNNGITCLFVPKPLALRTRRRVRLQRPSDPFIPARFFPWFASAAT